MSKDKVIRREIGGHILRQNCFRRECVDHTLQSPIRRQPVEYVELVRHMQPDGIKEVYEKKEYPITPEYVSSFAVSTDYKKDNSLIRPMSELAPGLGDVRDIQRMADMDSLEIERLTKQYNEAVSKLKQKLMQNKTAGTQSAGTQSAGEGGDK